MKGKVEIEEAVYSFDLSLGIDISIPMGREASPNAFHLTPVSYQTVQGPGFTGDVSQGGSCNCENILFNPHGDGTHTECAGHVSAEKIFINDVLKQFFFSARLITISPLKMGNDSFITENLLRDMLEGTNIPFDAVIIRTLPNQENKKTRNYSGGNAPYFEETSIDYLNSIGIKHILTDLPSLDKEEDPSMQAHKSFFGYPHQWNLEKTVTEMIFIPDEVEDGNYLLNLQIAPFESDASPSKPVLYRIYME